MNVKKYTEANRIAWNEAMPKHQAVLKEKWDKLFMEKGTVLQEGVELERLEKIGIQGKRIAHFCCNNGVQLLSLKNMGADRCIGFDISDEAIKEGNERAKKCGIDCTFVQTDIYEIPEEFNNSFDLVYVTIGALGWLPDLDLFFEKVWDVLILGGKVFIYEQHPFTELFPDDDDPEDSLKVVNPYFKQKPYISNDGIDYVGQTTYESSTLYWFTYTLSDIIMGMIKSKIKVDYFQEYEHNISEVCESLEKEDSHLPLSYILIGEKEN
ncbi:MAG: class I SAM-dependent methyltransferase [Halanaerobiales bacterium]|nr:class I SAM-dependent methyltransferase [Halanaerobiales bacterium]